MQFYEDFKSLFTWTEYATKSEVINTRHTQRTDDSMTRLGTLTDMFGNTTIAVPHNQTLRNFSISFLSILWMLNLRSSVAYNHKNNPYHNWTTNKLIFLRQGANKFFQSEAYYIYDVTEHHCSQACIQGLLHSKNNHLFNWCGKMNAKSTDLFT